MADPETLEPRFRVIGCDVWSDDPDFTVNPLSLLAPGFLRKIFSGRSAPPDEEFLKSLQRETD